MEIDVTVAIDIGRPPGEVAPDAVNSENDTGLISGIIASRTLGGAVDGVGVLHS